MSHVPRDATAGLACGTPDASVAIGLTDAQLLERFVVRHDEAAFKILLQRHGPMVLGMCRRVLHHEQDAEDAFQATFLVLVRKAASIVKRQSVGSWLYGAAYRVAMKAKTRALRRRAYERQVVTRSMADPDDDILWRDLKPVLDEEVHRLPEKYRAPVVLCYLEGMPYAEAARQLGCSKGLIALRLAEARERLRDRLNRRGVVFGVGLFPQLLAPQRVTVPVPDELGETTTQAALHWTLGGQAAVHTLPAAVVALTQAGLAGLAWAKLKIAVAVILAVSVIGGSTGVILQRVLNDGPAAGGSAPGSPKKGRKTLADRLEGLPTKTKGTTP
jgi:RNA polymerase sigma factor (sigma-70 family)